MDMKINHVVCFKCKSERTVTVWKPLGRLVDHLCRLCLACGEEVVVDDAEMR
jgi:hypothetical protein